MMRRLVTSPLLPGVIYLFLVLLQGFYFSQPMDETGGKWFFYGTDTVSHDAVVHQWVGRQHVVNSWTIPLWMPELHGGLPTIGAFLWTPLSPAALGFPWLEYPDAQRLGWLLSLWIGGMGGWFLGRSLGMRISSALLVGMVWMLCGHVVTLIHAGHFQKVMALGWLPWMVAGAALVTRGRAKMIHGVAIGGLGIGMMFLSGHPQIAYAGLGMSALLILFATLHRRKLRRRPLPSVLALGGIMVVGFLLGGGQLLPGVEMSGWSNRSGGVEWEEAVATSYPPGELAEFAVPLVKGSSVMGDVYTGEWGERIVSDYIGIPVLLLALLGLGILGWRTGRHRAMPWLIIIAGSLLVGLGDNTPLYRFLYNYLPGFSSFRSPATFFCATSLGLAVMAGHGIGFLGSLCRKTGRPIVYTIAFGVIFTGISLDLAAKNSHFLHRLPWAQYRLDFLQPNAADEWIAEKRYQLEVMDLGNDLSLRPILFHRRAINGYHPITWRIKVERDRELGLYSHTWHQAWGLPVISLRTPVEFDEEAFLVLERINRAQRIMLRIRGVEGHTSGHSLRSIIWQKRDANYRTATVRSWGGPLRIADVVAPGWHLYINDELQTSITEPALDFIIETPEGTSELELVYKPFSWRGGFFMTTVGWLAICLMLTTVYTPRRRRRSSTI